MKYVRKAIEIEAVQFTRGNWDEVVSFTEGRAKNVTTKCCPNGAYYCWLDTDSGNVKVFEGEYISKDEFGTLCVYNQYAFESSFDAVVDQDVEEDTEEDKEEEGGEENE